MTIDFDYPSPDTTIPWEVKGIAEGVVARYRRTIAGKTSPISGTGGYRYGVDYHIEIHCTDCCCEASEDQGCRHPAGGFTVISSRSGQSHLWGVAIASMAGMHLSDPLRHSRGTPLSDIETALEVNCPYLATTRVAPGLGAAHFKTFDFHT